MVDTNMWFFHLIPVVMMICVALSNNMLNFQRADRKLDQESARLRAGLSAELQALQDLHATNLQLLDREAGYLLSSRSIVALYRGNLGRLTMLLDGDAIAKVVECFAQNEKIEALLTAAAQPKGGASYRIAAGDIDALHLRQLYETTGRSIIAARRSLEGAPASNVPSVWQGLRSSEGVT
jgi:hypothetical protein